MRRPEANQTSFLVGVAFVMVAVAAMYFSRDIAQSIAVQSRGGVGPRAFPIGLSCLLLLGGCYHCASWLVNRVRHGAVATTAASEVAGQPDTPGRWLDVLVLIIALGLYITMIDLLGFTLSTAVFSVWLMHRLGSSWWVALVASGALTVATQLLFFHFFQVQLPSGKLGFDSMLGL